MPLAAPHETAPVELVAVGVGTTLAGSKFDVWQPWQTEPYGSLQRLIVGAGHRVLRLGPLVVHGGDACEPAAMARWHAFDVV